MLIFEYRCVTCGSVTEKVMAAEMKQDEHDQIICPECARKGRAEYAYLVFVKAAK
jgi:DNA-directed RNA polymerase subunit RPC12/RpoP